MRTYGRVAVQLHALLTSALDGGELSASRSDRFILEKKRPLHPFYRSLVGPQSHSGRGGDENKFIPLSEIEPQLTSP